jgi:hypothetical protein
MDVKEERRFGAIRAAFSFEVLPVPPDLEQSLDAVAAAAGMLRDDWWIIGSAAAMLAGLDLPVADVDLLVTEADGQRLLQAWRLAPAEPAPSPLFASALFATAKLAPLPIEVMAGTHVRGEPLQPATRIVLPWKDGSLAIPHVAEQIAICRRFGRDKDLRRAALLETLL